MILRRTGATGLLCTAMILGATSLAAAHHAMDGAQPTTLMQGLLSGLGHPIIGFDHLTALIAVSAIAAWYRNAPALVCTYVAALLFGAALHVGEMAIPAAELLVGLSVIALGGLLFIRESIAASIAVVVFAVAGIVHGFALGESIVGAEATPLAAYFAGLGIVHAAIALGVAAAVRGLTARHALVLRLASAAVILVGVIAVAQNWAA